MAIVMSEVFLRRLSPSLAHFVRRQLDFRILSIHRPKEELRASLETMRPAGLITEWLPDITEFLIGLGYPTVVADSDEEVPGGAAIDIDDWEVGREAARYFLRGGHRNFAFLGNSLPYSGQRYAGFSEELQQAGIDPPTSYVEEEPSGKQYLEDLREPQADFFHWLEELPKPVAVFAAHDPLGRFLCEACRVRKIRVPDEVSVLGANDDPLVGALSFPSLSSVQIPWERIGIAVGEAMNNLLAKGGQGSKPLLLSPGGVEVRQSSDTFHVEDPVLRRALGWLQQHHRESVGIEDLCRGLRVSRRSLERKFNEYLRKTPYQALSELRVETARRLLVETNEPMPLVAELSGFGDAERLSVVFRRVTGKRPSDFRKRF
ncbi:substrate-binding domain-containing protein [Puniceicoccus vermicola]